MQLQDYDIVGSFNNQRVSGIDAERTVNLFEYLDPLGKKPKSLISTSGIEDSNINFAGATGGFRAEFVYLQSHFVVIGNNVYLINSANVASQINTSPLVTDAGYVGIDANNATNPQVIFVDGQNGYIWDTVASTWTKITDTSFPANPIDVCYLDGFFVVANGGTNNFQLSSFNQGLIWGPDSATGTNTFTMAAGASNIVLTSGTAANYQVGIPVVFSGGSLPAELVAGTTYYVVLVVNSTTIKVSATLNGGAITSVAGGSGDIANNGQLQQGSITSHPGNIVACRTLHRRLFLFSQNYTEVWENQGIGTNLPVRRNNSLLMEYGTPAIASIRTGFDTMFFLAQDKDGLGSVMMVNGTQSIPISTRALDYQLAQYASELAVSDACGVLIKENGIIFYRLNFTAANHTYVYNVTQSDPTQDQTKFWHEEELLNGDRHPAQTHGYFNGKNYFGDYQSPILYYVDNSLFTNNGEAIHRMRISRSIVPPGYQRTRIDRLQIDLLQGTIDLINESDIPIPLLTEDGFTLLTEDDEPILLEQGLRVGDFVSPVVFLSISKDGGQNYGYKLQAPMGEVGQTTFRTLFRKLGVIPRGQGFVTKLEFYDPVPFQVLGAAWAFEVLPE